MFSTLITVSELASLANDSYLLFDCRFDLAKPQWGESVFAQNHLPQARYLHLDRDLSAAVTAVSGRHPLPSPEEFAQRLGRWGVDEDRQVIAYDQGNGVYAARLWWMLRWLGHRNVAVLDGGVTAWLAAGLPLSNAEAGALPTRRYRAQPRANATIDVNALQRELAAQTVLLVDGRGADRFAGQNETIDRVAGHVPGAVNHAFARNLNEQQRFLPPLVLRERWLATLAGRPASDMVAMCGSGVSACHNLLALAHAGLGDVTLYPGSWSEWIRDPRRPVAIGSA